MKVLKFGATWCSGCVIMKPRWKKIEQDHPWLKTEYYDFDTEVAKKLAGKYDIQSLPTFIFLDNQENEITRLNGEIDESKLVKLINEYRNK